MKVEEYKTKYYTQVRDIYIKSFPEDERYISLEKMIERKNTKLYCLVEKEIVLGIMYLIMYNDMIFLLYLAIDNKKRSKGYGSYLLKWCLKKYTDKKIYLNIEEVNKEAIDYEIRKKRLDFYLKNGFFLTNYISKEEVQNFNILSNNTKIDINEYKKLDKFISEILDEPISNIVRF